jgi:hypothetical protein
VCLELRQVFACEVASALGSRVEVAVATDGCISRRPGAISAAVSLWRRHKAAKRAEAESQAAVREPRSLFEGLLDQDGVLPVEGIGKLFMFMGEHRESRPAILRELWVPMQLALAQGGRFIAEDNTSLLLHEGEKALYDAPAYLLKEVTDRELRGASQGISVPLGHGVRYRVGSVRGQMVTIGSHWTTADEGL